MTTDIASFLAAQSDATRTIPAPATATPRNTILHGNCLDVLPRLSAQSVDFVLTDPPYVTRYRDRAGRCIPNDRFNWLRPGFADDAGYHRVASQRLGGQISPFVPSEKPAKPAIEEPATA